MYESFVFFESLSFDNIIVAARANEYLTRHPAHMPIKFTQSSSLRGRSARAATQNRTELILSLSHESTWI